MYVSCVFIRMHVAIVNIYLDVAYVSHICCMCFIRMFAYGYNGFQVCLRCVSQVFQKHISSVSIAFRCMLQPLFLDVAEVDWVLHLSSSHLLLHLAVGSRGADAWWCGARALGLPDPLRGSDGILE
jgi:hypothetical protein